MTLTISAKKLELSLKRYYVVCAVQASRPDKVAEFFERLGTDLQAAEWRDWFRTPNMHLMAVLDGPQ